jgi:hypothetical protein
VRGFVAGLVVVIGLLLVPLADAAVWTRRELLPRGSFANLASEVLDEREVRDALAARIVDDLDREVGLSSDAREVVEPAVRTGLATEEFRGVFRDATGALHDQLTGGDDRLLLELDGVLPIVRARVSGIDDDLADEIPDSLPGVTVLTQDELPTFFRAVDVVRRASLAFPIAAFVLLALAVAIARRRANVMIVVGIGVALIALVLAALVELGRDLLSDVVGSALDVDAFEAGYDVVMASFVIQTLALAVLGVVTALGGGLLKFHQIRTARPSDWA